MKEKVGFMMYKGMYPPIRNLSDDKFGKLMKAIFNYQEDGVIEKLPDDIEMAFGFFRNQFDIDNKKYEEMCKKRQEIGKLGGRPKQTKDNQNNQKVNGETKITYNENETEKENKKENKKANITKELKAEALRFIDRWNEIFKREHTATKDFTDSYISIRKNYTHDDIKKGLGSYYGKNKTRVDDIEWRDNYYLTPIKFIKQKTNGLVSYL